MIARAWGRIAALLGRLLGRSGVEMLGVGISGFLVRVLGTVLIMALTIAMTRTMGAAGYGAYAYAMAVSYIFVVLATFGLPISSNRILTRYFHRGRHAAAASFSLFSIALICIVTPIVGAVAAWPLRLLTGTSDVVGDPLILAALVLSVGLMRYLSESTRALELPLAGMLWESIGQRLLFGAAFFGAWALLGGELGARGAVVAYILATLVAVVVLGAASVRRIGRVPWRAITFRPWRDWLGISLHMVTTPVFYFVVSETDVLIIGALLGPGDVGLYQVARRLADLVSFASSAINVLGLSRIARLRAAGDAGGLKETIGAINWAAATPAVLGFVVLAIIGHWVLGLFGPEFPEVWALMLAITGSRLVDILFGPTSEILLMSGYHREAGRLNSILMVANILLNLSLIPLLGLWGAVIATTSIVIIWNIYQYRLVRRALRIDASLVGRALTRLLALAATRPPASRPAP
jgi:O-antigen/teichoic acid export membrane protein